MNRGGRLAPISKNPANVAARARKKISKRAQNKKLPEWIQAIPESQSHGSGTLQKRLWRVVSDYARIRDWYEYGFCAATGKKIFDWRAGHGGHLISYSKCNGMFKFDERNVHLQSPKSNKLQLREDWHYFERELERRYRIKGYKQGYVEFLEEENLRHTGETLSNEKVIAKIKFLLVKMDELPEKPEYYPLSRSLLVKSGI